MRVNDAVIGLIIIVLSTFIIIEARSYPALPGVPYGPDLFPTVIAGAMILGGIILIFKGLRNVKITGWYKLEDWARVPRTYMTLAMIALSLFFYILFSEMLGFMITSVVILFSLLLWTRRGNNTVSSLVISISFSVLIFVVFAKLMRIPLPAGIMQGVF